MLQSLSGDNPAAATTLNQALDIHRELGDRGSEAGILNDLGNVLTELGDTPQAHDRHTQALVIARDISSPVEEVRALEGIGNCMLHDGDPDAAVYWRQALTVSNQIGAPDAERLRDALRQHGSTPTATGSL